MEEKERYVIRYDLDYNQCLIDTEKNQGVGDYIRIVKLLNQQDKELSKLRASYQQVKEENQQLKQQLHELPKKIVSDIKDCLLDFSNGWWRYFMTDGCEYMLSSDLQSCLDETIDTVLKKFGGENE